MPNNETLAIIAAFVGALGAGMVGWWDAHEPFDPHKFLSNVWRAIFAAMTYALGIQGGALLTDGSMWGVIATAFLVGAGVEGLGKKIQSAATPAGPSISDKLDKLQSTLENVGGPPTPTGGATP
jgi:hypothetical protein